MRGDQLQKNRIKSEEGEIRIGGQVGMGLSLIRTHEFEFNSVPSSKFRVRSFNSLESFY